MKIWSEVDNAQPSTGSFKTVFSVKQGKSTKITSERFSSALRFQTIASMLPHLQVFFFVRDI